MSKYASVTTGGDNSTGGGNSSDAGSNDDDREDEDEAAQGAVLFPAYPNPFNSAVRIPYRLVEDGRLNQALDVLAVVGSGNSLAKEADVLRAEIQRQLLSLPSVPVFSTGSRVGSPR